MTYPNVQLMIDGQWCDAASKKTLAVMNPATARSAHAHAEKAGLDRALEAAAGEASRPGARWARSTATR